MRRIPTIALYGIELDWPESERLRLDQVCHIEGLLFDSLFAFGALTVKSPVSFIFLPIDPILFQALTPFHWKG